MKTIRFFIIAIAISIFSISLSGQSRTGYFVHNSTMRHNFNAAFAPDQGYVGIPVVGNINVGLYSNMGMSNFIYQLDNGKMGLFLNKGVSSDEFLSSLPELSYLNGNLNMDILNAGFFTWKDSFWTIDVGVKTDINSTIPKEFFSLMKNGMETDPQRYTIEDFTLGANVYGQVSLGYSQGLDKLLKGLRLGAKLKFLMGLQNASATIQKMDVYLGSDKWAASSQAEGYVLGGGMEFDYNDEGNIENIRFEPSKFALAGAGLAIDLGVEYRISQGTKMDGLTFSLAVKDLGFISYFKDQSRVLETDGSTNFEFEGFQNVDLKNLDFKDEVEKLKDDLLKMVAFKDSPAESAQTKSLAAKVYAGVEYPFFKDRFRVGLLYSGKYSEYRNEHELTLSCNYAPKRWFDVAVSYSFLNSRQSIGWLVTFVPRKGLNFFIGSDYTAFDFSPYGIPVKKSYVDVNVGISVPLGGTNKRF